MYVKGGGGLDFFVFMYVIQHCCICRPSYSTVSKDAGIEPSDFGIDTQTALTTRLDLIHIYVNWIHADIQRNHKWGG